MHRLRDDRGNRWYLYMKEAFSACNPIGSELPIVASNLVHMILCGLLKPADQSSNSTCPAMSAS